MKKNEKLEILETALLKGTEYIKNHGYAYALARLEEEVERYIYEDVENGST